MAINLYNEPKKVELTESAILSNFEIKQQKGYWAVRYKNQVILKLSSKATDEEVKTYLTEHKSIVKKFIEKVKSSNEKRINSIKKRSNEIKEMKAQVKMEKLKEDYKKKLSGEEK